MKTVSRSGVFLLLLFTAGLCNGSQESATTEAPPKLWTLAVDPPSLELITELIPYTANMTLIYNSTEVLPFDTKDALFIVKINMSNSLTVTVDMEEIEFSWEDISEGYQKTLEVTGQIIGYVDLIFKLEIYPIRGADVLETVPLSRYLVTVIRADALWENMFTIVMGILAILNTINMGCALDLQVVKANILRPVGPVVGFISQFTFMPLFSAGMAILLIEDPLKGFGLLVIGVCPGGLASNFWTLLLDGDVNLSITMTFVSSLAAMGMMPLWLWLLSGYFLPEGSAVQVPYLDMTVSLVLLTIPLGIGLLIRRCKPKVAEFLSVKIMKPFAFVFIIIMFGLGFYSLSHIFVLLDIYMLSAGLAVAAAGFIFGGTFAWITRLNKAEIIAVSLETAMQNGNVAFVLLKTSLPAPYSDIAALPPIAQILMTSAILFVLYGINMTVKCCIKKCCKKDKKDVEMVASTAEDETAKALMMREYADSGNSSNNNRRDETPPPNYYGGQVTPEFSWAQNTNLMIPNSPTPADPRRVV